MAAEDRIELPKVQGHSCFACGTANPIGLNLEFYRLGDFVCSDVVLEKYYEGWENMAHGGIISTLLDEVMSWTILYFKRIFFVTRKMEVKYVRPVLIGIPLQVRGRLMNETREGLVGVQAEIRDERKKILCKAVGEFVELPAERLAVVPEGLKKDMEELFEKFGGVV
jgi:uncharacterized protein (TIGR00369 family)